MTNDFALEFAIVMPDGEFYRSRPFILPSLFGGKSADGGGDVVLYRTRAEADSALASLKARAAEMGVGDWCGFVVQRLCSPFTVRDPAAQFASEIESWMEGQS